MTKLIDYLKSQQPFDHYILFLVALGFSKTDIHRLTGISRQGVYAAIRRNRAWLEANDIEVPPLADKDKTGQSSEVAVDKQVHDT